MGRQTKNITEKLYKKVRVPLPYWHVALLLENRKVSRGVSSPFKSTCNTKWHERHKLLHAVHLTREKLNKARTYPNRVLNNMKKPTCGMYWVINTTMAKQVPNGNHLRETAAPWYHRILTIRHALAFVANGIQTGASHKRSALYHPSAKLHVQTGRRNWYTLWYPNRTVWYPNGTNSAQAGHKYENTYTKKTLGVPQQMERPSRAQVRKSWRM